MRLLPGFAAILLSAGGCHHAAQVPSPVTPSAEVSPAAPPPVAEDAGAAEPAPMPAKVSVDFASQIKPILEARCQPCHFPGGVMYERLPFDQAATIHTLGTKLFTRIKDENEQRVIRDFLLTGRTSSASETPP
jgi:hypothetical protein